MDITHWFETFRDLPRIEKLRWAGRLLILILVLGVIRQRPAYVVVGAPQTVDTQQPVTCVHTRLTDEVEEWKIQRTLVMAREMGATTIVEFFPWAYIEPVEGEYTWQHSDLVIEHAQAQGLTVIARLGMVPVWARPDPDDTGQETSLNYLTPDHDEDFADFAAAFAERYRDQVDYVLIWNEPNLAFEWGFQPVAPQRYVDLLSVVTPAVRAANPDMIIMAGALAPTLEPVGSPNGMNDLDYLRGLYEAGFSQWYDALAIHTYGFRFPADDPPADDVLNFRRAELLRDMMVVYGDGDKPVIVTESGWNDHPRWTKAVSPSQRITYTLDGLEIASEDWSWLDHLCTWAFRYPTPTYSYPDYFTLVDVGFTPRPIYYEIQAWARGWEDSE